MNALRAVKKGTGHGRQPSRRGRQPSGRGRGQPQPSGRGRGRQPSGQSVPSQVEPFSDITDVERPMMVEDDIPEGDEDNFSRQPNRPRRQTKLLDRGNVTELPPVNRQKYNFTPSSKETRFYKSVIPWMRNQRNDGIFILSIGGTDISPYLVQQVPGIRYTVSHNGQVFYRAGEKFRQLMVDFRFKRSQVDDVLYVTTPNGVLKFKIGYLFGDTLTVQNGDIFSDEMKFFNDGLQTQYSRILKIKDEAIDEDVKHVGISVLSKALHDVAPNVMSYGIYDTIVKRDTSYIINVIDTLVTKSSNVNDFLEYLGNIVIFITTINFSNVFRERLKEEYYLPHILANLPLSEKIPEIYDKNLTGRDEEKRKMNEIIEESLKIFVYRLLVLIYVRRNPTERIESGTVNYSITPSISNLFNTMSDWKSNCVNVNNIPDNEIVLYKDERGTVYCLSIPEVSRSISEGNKINIHSGKEYSQEFVDYINKYYTVVEKETPQEDDVSELVEDMEKLKVDNSNLDIEDLFADLTMSEEEDVNVNVNREEVQEEEKYPESDSDNEEEIDVSENTVNVSNKKECQVCKKMFNATGAYKTINDKSELVEYCSMECFNK